jgi:exodeoxyribonuclease V alpha subunit
MTPAEAAAAPADRIADAFAQTVSRLHLSQQGAPEDARLVAEWARRAWRAAADGHVCVEPDPAGEAGGLAALRASPAVTEDPARHLAPLVLDEGALYLHRLWQAETTLAAALARLDHPDPLAPAAETEAVLASLFPGVPAADPQLRAVQAGLGRRLAVVSGGPGTGKTTTMARLLVACMRLRPDARVAFAAPTGKAAARLAQSLAAQLPALDPDGRVAARLPASGSTVHRLLGLGRALPGRLPAARPLAFDLVIVDEASMLDVELASRLFAAIPPGGRLVLAGDMDQLASVEAGAVFADLCASALAGTVRLERNYRQADAPRLVALAAAMRAGDPGALSAALRELGADDAQATPPDPARIAQAAIEAYEPAIRCAEAGAPPGEVLAAYERYRVLTALREGDAGARGLNAAIAARLRRRLGVPAQAEWYPGRLVMVGRNEPGLELFNGDVGVCLAAPDGRLAVAFDAGGGMRWVPLLQMPSCDDAFAITVHKSQGSEFEAVAFVPGPPGHPLNTRELVYTAVTRARRGLRLWAGEPALQAAAANRTRRHGRLAARLAAFARGAGRVPDAG